MKKAVFLDRDGTINVDTGYINDPDDLVFIRGAKEGVKFLKNKGFLVFVVTNQSGVGRGYFSLKKLKAVNDRLLTELSKLGINLDGIFMCPHHPNRKCSCRKPKPKLVYDIAKKYKINLEKSYFVGDKLIDVQTGKNAGCKTVLIDADTTPKIENEEDWTQPDFIARNLKEVAKWIVKDSYKKKQPRDSSG